MKSHIIFTLALSIVTAHAWATSADKLKCDDGVVSMSDSKYEIVHKCGQPTVTDFSRVTRTFEGHEGVLQKFVTVERWLYNFGPERFVMVLTFEEDKLMGMRKLGYGKPDADEPDFSKKVDIGDLAVRVLFLYGPPSHKEERVETAVMSHKEGLTLPMQRTVEKWIYNLGSNRFMRIYTFVNGRLRKIEQGEKGF